ncbi:hypothetical protein LINPERPRIM_LOCUS21442 [Linum perenne]
MAAVSTKTLLHLLLIFTLVLSTTAMMKTGRRLTLGQEATTVTVSSVAGKLVCSTVYGTESGDTCTSVASSFGLSESNFLGMNPNINCATIFVGQWLCIAA